MGTGGADAGAVGACKAVVSACQDPSKCNVVSTFKHPSCHTDAEGSSDAYRYCTFWTSTPGATPELDGHCDEATGCQGTFETMMRGASQRLSLYSCSKIQQLRFFHEQVDLV